jgi:LysM repeat protein
MAHRRRPSPARYLAPLALLLCAVAAFAVVKGSSMDGDEGAKEGSGKQAGEGRTTTNETSARTGAASYTVKVDDSLGAIAEKTGVPLERLLELNPELDPQALEVGQKIKLRE